MRKSNKEIVEARAVTRAFRVAKNVIESDYKDETDPNIRATKLNIYSYINNLYLDSLEHYDTLVMKTETENKNK